MPRFRKLKSGAYLEVSSGRTVSKDFVSHELSRTRNRFTGAERYRPEKEYRTMKEIIDRVRELDRFDDIEALREEGIFGLIRKLSAEGRSEEY